MAYKKKSHTAILIFCIFLILGSCTSYKKTLYFQGDNIDLPAPNLVATYLLKKHDIVQIQIINPEAENPQVLSSGDDASSSAGESAYFTDYYINDSGYVDLPIIGKVKLENYTLMQADSLLSVKVIEYFAYGTVDIKMASFNFLAMGEFKTPGKYNVPNESCTIYEALAIAGDAGEYPNKTKTQLIRTLKDGSKKIYRIDLTDYSAFTSDTYYIQPNDIIYIQPQKSKTDKQNLQNLTLGLALISTTLIVISFLNK